MFVTRCWQRNSDAYNYINKYIAAYVLTQGQVYCSGCDLKSTVMFCDCMMMNVIMMYIYNVPISTVSTQSMCCVSITLHWLVHFCGCNFTGAWSCLWQYIDECIPVMCMTALRWQVHCCVCDCLLMSTYVSHVWLLLQVHCCVCDCWWIHTCHVYGCTDKYIVVLVTVCWWVYISVMCMTALSWQVHGHVCDCMLMSTYLSCVWLALTSTLLCLWLYVVMYIWSWLLIWQVHSWKDWLFLPVCHPLSWANGTIRCYTHRQQSACDGFDLQRHADLALQGQTR